MNDWKKVKSNEVIQTELPQNIAMSATTFLTMALATERYLAVCRPILYRSLGTTILAKFFFLTISMPTSNPVRSMVDRLDGNEALHASIFVVISDNIFRGNVHSFGNTANFSMLALIIIINLLTLFNHSSSVLFS